MANPFRFNRLMQHAGNYSLATIIGFIVHLPNFIRLFYRLLHDKRVPIHLKALCWGAIAYFFLPWDLLPDLGMLGLGYADDLIFLFLAFKKLVNDSPPDVVREHVQAISGSVKPPS
jgi:uncharacterized membrane protein YkvA (DUF1232 family)